MAESTILFLTTPDGALESVWNELKKESIQNKIVCHFSGSLSSDLFSNREEYGVSAASFHPMYAFSSKFTSYEQLNHVIFTAEGDSHALSVVGDIFRKAGNKVCVMESAKKSRYLLAKYLAAFVSGAAASVMPMLLSLIVTMPYFPCIPPAMTSFQSGIVDRQIFSEYYFIHPWIYFGLFLVLGLAAGGLLAGSALAVSCFITKPIAVLFMPFLVYNAVNYALASPAKQAYSLAQIIDPKSKATLVTLPLAVKLIGGGILLSLVCYYAIAQKRERIR